ncbi:hypothetical protein [Vibrio campbellii]|uniref:Uncharacterized protein n=1 Tax=Vibrio campbellii TaxID=680 RepID=A0AAQ3AZ08_9VIBR|nr:hypothetical protein [Vibrio campbellii]WDG07202.1 hypothetical protein PUN50_10615 [Vibrio campbellii]
MFVDTVKSAFSSLSTHKQAIAKATALPILLSIILDLLLSKSEGDGATVLVQILMALLSAIVAINVHSIILKGPQSVPQWGRFTFGKIEMWFIGHYLAMTIAVVAVAALFAMINVALAAIALLALGVICCRLVLVFPAIAIGKGVSFPYAWNLTKGHTWYMMSVVILVPLLLGLAMSPLAFLQLPFLMSLLSFVVTIIGIAILSKAYEQLSGFDGESYSQQSF